MTLYYYMYKSWQDCCRRGENRSWPSVSVDSVESEYWCLNNAFVYAFIMRLTVEEHILWSTFKLNTLYVQYHYSSAFHYYGVINFLHCYQGTNTTTQALHRSGKFLASWKTSCIVSSYILTKHATTPKQYVFLCEKYGTKWFSHEQAMLCLQTMTYRATSHNYLPRFLWSDCLFASAEILVRQV
jgi:hypothetical protein